MNKRDITQRALSSLTEPLQVTERSTAGQCRRTSHLRLPGGLHRDLDQLRPGLQT